MMPAMRPRSSEDTRRRSLPLLTDRLALGRTGLSVSRYCLGHVRSARIVPAAFDAGINFFFLTTDMHWPLYEETRRGLRMLLERGGTVRDQIVVAGTSYCTQPEFAWMPYRELVDAVPRLGRLDVAVAGGATLPELRQRIEILREQRRERHLGIRAVGASFHRRKEAREIIRAGQLDLAYVRYNASHTGARDDLFPHLPRPRRTRVYNFLSTRGHVPPEVFARLGLGRRYWQPTVTDHYRFAMSRPELDGILCAFGKERHVRELADALARGPLAADEEQYLVDLCSLAEGRASLA